MAFIRDHELYKDLDSASPEDNIEEQSWLEVGFATDPGKSGKVNQDYYGIVETNYLLGQQSDAETPIIVGVVADGISSSNSSDIAGQLAVETIRRVLIENPSIPIKPRLDAAIRRANKEVFRIVQENSAYSGAGATIVAAAFAADQLYVAHLGDSRAYLIRNRKLHLLTVDHRWGQEAVDADELSPEEAMAHADRNLITRILGVTAQVEVDHQIIDIEKGAFDPNKIQRWPLVDRMWMQPGDIVLLCSDGLSDVLPAHQIEATINRHPPQVAAQRLIDLVNAAGGPDNVTVLIFKLPAPKSNGVAWTPEGTPVQASKNRPNYLLRTLTILLMLAALASGVWVIKERWSLRNLHLPTFQITSTATDGGAATDQSVEGPPFKIVQPQAGAKLGGVQHFEWNNTTPLKENESYELLIWSATAERATAKAVGGLSQENKRILNLNSIGLTPGEYRWGVRIVQLETGSEVAYLGGDQTFTYTSK
ncbi:MAG: protein phosphatase 2C domain-containing protein [Caldilineaceae bacterium]